MGGGCVYIHVCMIPIQLPLVVSIIVTETKCFFFNGNASLSRSFVTVVVRCI